MDYLKDESYYKDLYDLHTIKECLSYIDKFHNLDFSKDKLGKEHTKEQLNNYLGRFAGVFLWIFKGERYKEKGQTIQKWMERDRIKQEKYDNTEPPRIFCPDCDEVMYMKNKDLNDWPEGTLRVLFFMDCPTCNRRKAVYDNGEEWRIKANPCPKCGNPLTESHKKKGEVITWKSICPQCGYKEVIVDDFDKNHEKYEQERKDDQKLLEKYRSEYCFSEKEGLEYLSSKENIKHLRETIEEHERKEKDPAYKKVAQLNKLKVIELEKLLVKTLEKEKYVKLSLDKPEMGQFVIIPLTIQDADSKREEYDSKTQLRRLINKTLEKTNWRLMSEGVVYRLGLLTGRLKAYEKEEDLASLIRKQKNG